MRGAGGPVLFLCPNGDTRAPAQAPERSGETRGKCPEKARSRSGHALVASWSCTGSCGLSMTTSTPESADDFDQVHLQPHTRLPVPLLRPQGNKPPEFSVPIPSAQIRVTGCSNLLGP